MAKSRTEYKLIQRLHKRLIVFVVIVIIALFGLLLRLFQLQILEGAKYYIKSQRVIRKVVSLPAPRGEVFDRHYKKRETANKIIENFTTLSLIAIPSHFKKRQLEENLFKLEKTLKINDGKLLKKITKSKISKNEEIILIENLSENQLTILADYYIKFSKFIVRQSTTRKYSLGRAASHLTGYIGLPSNKDITSGIKSYQYVGKNGLELIYDRILRGEDGEIVQLKTARGSIEEQKVFKNFIPGNNLILTIDRDLQEILYNAMKEKKGGGIVLKPSTGEILAIVSKPDYDPNVLVSFDKKKRYEHLKEIRKFKAELNRVISAKYPPASTFKPLVALAALEEKQINAHQTFNCPGKFVLKSSYAGFPDTTFHCWKKHHRNDLIGGIAQSCSVYFFQLGYMIGAEPMIKYARYFLLDAKSGIDLPSEIAGFVPSSLWKQKKFNQRWYDGDTVNLSVGQGFIETTLLGMTNFYSAIIMNGLVYKPHLIKEIRFAENDDIKETIKPEILIEYPISSKNLEIIRKSLRAVVTRGTARGVFGYGNLMPLAGKTGTVQTKSNDRFDQASQHGWFIGYGPYGGDKKDIILVAVFAEKGRGGSVGAAPVARTVFQEWTRRLKTKKKLD